MNATASGASLPWAANWNQSGVRQSAITATAAPHAAATPPSLRRKTRRAAPASASSAPARATTSQSAGGRPRSSSPSGAASVVKATGSGFQEGPPVVSSWKCASSRPHTTQAIGS